MKKKIALILALALVFLLSAPVFATMTAGGTSGIGNATRDGSVNGGMGTDGNGVLTDGTNGGTTGGAVDGSGPVNDTAGEGGSWVGVVIAIIIAAVLVAVIIAILPRKR